MINRICCICKEYVDAVWTVALRDDKEVKEFSGHFKCVTDLQDSMNSVKDSHKKNVKQILKEINYKEMD